MEFKFQEWMHNYASDQLRLVFEASGFYWTLGWFLASKQAPFLKTMAQITYVFWSIHG